MNTISTESLSRSQHMSSEPSALANQPDKESRGSQCYSGEYSNESVSEKGIQEKLLQKLNESQQAAVRQGNGPMLILAGAGSGKTRVLTHKIAYMLASGIESAEILAVTFTNKAAKEMRSRVETLVGESEGKALWIGTFHSICGRILRREIPHYITASGRSWNNHFVIYDETESLDALKQAIKKLNLDEKLYTPKNIRYLISGLKNQLIDAYQYASSARDFKAERLAAIFDAYEDTLARNNALDFDDLILLTVKLFQSQPQARAYYHDRFKHILTDEFQDTNDAQYELIRLLAENCPKGDATPEHHKFLWKNRSLTVVGDVDQSIYSWRGANVNIILNFQRDFPDTQVIKLLQNYRSTQSILEVANAVIENNKERLPKELIAVRGAGQKVHCFEARDDREEALYIIDRFEQLTRTEEFKPGDCCILYRTNSQSRSLEDVLISRGLSYTMIGGLKFYERREIKDVLAYLTVIFNDMDSYSVKRVLNVPKRGIGKSTVEKMEIFASQVNSSLYQALSQADQQGEIQPKALKAIGSFVSLIERLKSLSETMTVNQLIVETIDQSGYIEELRLEDPSDSEGRIANVEEFVNVARQFHLEFPEGDLADFLTQMALLSDIDSSEPMENKYVLMTLHAAKGLEYPVVAICGLEEGLFPHARSLSDKNQMEEERRLMYVGITRAEERLFLTYARRRMIFGDLKYAMPSRFLKEIPQESLMGSYSLERMSSADQTAHERESSAYSKSSRYREDTFTHDFIDEPPPSFHSRKESKEPGKITLGVNKTQAKNIQSRFQSQSSPVKSGNMAVGEGVFQVGDRVSHPRFGTGVVEQVIGKTGKYIYNIYFDKISAKKLIDPRFTQLEKL